MSIWVSGMEFDVWVFILLGVYGELVVMCLLLKECEGLCLDWFGMFLDYLWRMCVWVVEFYGIILVIGFIGLGKFIMFYGVLEEINDGVCKFISVEDFVEY